MAGHSKWKNIKHKKAAADQKRSKIFSKMSRLIIVAARDGGGDPTTNAALRMVVDKAKLAKMPKENIERAIRKGTGELGGESYEEVIYEGYGPEGVAFYIKGLTDNRNRTVAEIRTLFTKAGGSMGASGSTAYIFSDPENPSFTIEVEDENTLQKLVDLKETLDDYDDVQEVFSNFV